MNPPVAARVIAPTILFLFYQERYKIALNPEMMESGIFNISGYRRAERLERWGRYKGSKKKIH